jgi:predicted dehydrogenase
VPEELQRVKERFGFEFATADYQEMLEKVSLDGVIVGSPHNVHHEHAKAALEKALPRLSRISRPLKRSIVGTVS